MAQRPSTPSILVVAAVPVLLTGCVQGRLAVDPSLIYRAVVLAGGAVGSGTRTGGSTTTTRSSGSARVEIPDSPPPTRTMGRVLDDAEQFIGVRYTWGGNTPQSGFDCSGFTKYLFARQGITIPRVSRDQVRAGSGVELDFGAMLPGDMLFFAEEDAAISHVGIYVGSGEMIHSSEALGGVNRLDLAGDYGAWYLENLVAVRRVAR